LRERKGDKVITSVVRAGGMLRDGVAEKGVNTCDQEPMNNDIPRLGMHRDLSVLVLGRLKLGLKTSMSGHEGGLD
jgi:hypothetical protein